MNKTGEEQLEVYPGRTTLNPLPVEDQMDVWINNAKKSKELDPQIALSLLGGIFEQAKLKVLQALQELKGKT